MNRVWNLVRGPLCWVLIAALVLRLVVGVWWQSRLPAGTRFAFPDSESYWVLAQTIARGEPYQFGSPDARVFRAPGYPLVLAGVFLMASGDAAVRLARALGAVLGTVAVAMVYILARQLFDERTALVAAVMTAVYPGAIGMSVFVLSEAAFCPLMLADLALATAAWHATSGKTMLPLAFAAGCMAGLATLVRPSWLVFVPFAIAAGFVSLRHMRKHLACGALALAGMCLVMTPWWVRNARVTGHFVPTTLQSGASLYDGLNPNANGGSNMSFVEDFSAREQLAPAGNDSFEYRLDRSLRTAAIEWATAHPRRVLQLAATKFARMWNIWPNEAEFRSWPLRLVVLVTYVPALVLGLVGAWRFTRGGWPYVLCWLPAVYFTILHMVFVSSIRYREPAMLPLLVLAAAAVVYRGKAPRVVVPLSIG
ncbi:MAG: glycosyltransferase family 39 protein [Planctomycetia bacterium]|nr:glycosyltransferase family 39 protein [Planctomycetia bacterium]